MNLKLTLLLIALVLIAGCTEPKTKCTEIIINNDVAILVHGYNQYININDSFDGDTFEREMCCTKDVCLG